MTFWPLQQKEKNYGKVFLTAFLVAAAIFLPAIFYNKGVLLLSNDFNTQQLPFYVLGNEQIKSGSLFFSHLTDLGTPFLGSYLFYMLGSPFFWITLLFPSSIVPYLMGPLLALKFAFAALTSYAFIVRYVRDGRHAFLGAMLYAFSGFQLFNMFYNHFHDMVVLFPLMLIAFDELMENDRRGWFALTVAINLSANYIFFVGQALFVVAYYIVKLCSGKYRFELRSFMKILLEAVLGVAAAAYVWVAIVFVAQNPRTGQLLSGWDAFVYESPMKYIEILRAFLFPADIPHIAPFYPKNPVTRWQSLQAYIPLFSVGGAIAMIRARSKSFVSRLLLICAVTAVIPIFNSMPYLFNSFYYARWYYIFLLFIALATAMALDNTSDIGEQLKVVLPRLLIVQIAFALVIALFPARDEQGALVFGLADKDYFGFYLVYVGIAIFGSVYVLYHLKQDYNANRLSQRLLAGVLAVVVVNGSVNVVCMKLAEGKTDEYSTSFIDGRDALDMLKTDDSFRIDTSRIYYNAHMWWGIPSMATFNSNISGAEMEFFDAIEEPRFVATFPDDRLYGLRALFSVKYVFYPEEMPSQMPGLTYLGTEHSYDYYENEHYIPMGFAYDYAISQSFFDNLPKDQKHLHLVQSMVLSQEQIEQYAAYITPQPTNGFPRMLGYQQYAQEVQNRVAQSADSFAWTKNGFDASIELEQPKLVFFSVPYDENFTAKVNGEPVEILCANYGFMAVACEAGENEISFLYYPRGFAVLMTVSILALLCIVACIVWSWWRRRKSLDASTHK